MSRMICLIALLTIPAPAQAQDGLPACHPVTLDRALCDPAKVAFTLDSTNPWYPLTPGLRVVLTGEEDGESLRVVRTVLPETRTVAGVEVHLLEHYSFVDGEIEEIALNFYVETVDGTVCYFGEDVTFYEDGEQVDTHGTWRAGEGGALPGVIMPADPKVGDAYYQEYAPGAALDQGRVDAVGLSWAHAGRDYPVVRIVDSNPIDDEAPCTAEVKRYAAGVGEIQDVALQATAVTFPGELLAPEDLEAAPEGDGGGGCAAVGGPDPWPLGWLALGWVRVRRRRRGEARG